MRAGWKIGKTIRSGDLSVKARLGTHGVIEINCTSGYYKVCFHRKYFERGFHKNKNTLHDKRNSLKILFISVTGIEEDDTQIDRLVDLTIKSARDILEFSSNT